MTEQLPLEHVRQIVEGRRKSLVNAGIPEALLSRGLGTLSNGAAIGEWLSSTGAETIRSGASWIIETLSDDGDTVLPLVARALHLNGIGCKVVRLGQLVRMVEVKDYEAMDALLYPTVLFVQRFFSATPRGASPERPFTAYQRQQIEDLLLERVSGAKANILGVTNRDRKGYNLLDWWDSSLLSGLKAETYKAGQ